MLGYFNPNLDQILTNTVIGLTLILNDIFNPKFVHILPEIGLKQPSIFYSVIV